jgi:hypothetical protein
MPDHVRVSLTSRYSAIAPTLRSIIWCRAGTCGVTILSRVVVSNGKLSQRREDVMPGTEDDMKTFETHERMIAGELNHRGYKSVLRETEHKTLFVFEVDDDFVAPKQHDLRRKFRKQRLNSPVKPRVPLTRQVLIAKGLVTPAPIAEVVKPAPIIVPEPSTEDATELTPAEFDALVAQSLEIPKPMPKIAAPKPAPKVQLPPGSTFNPFANLRDLLVTP